MILKFPSLYSPQLIYTLQQLFLAFITMSDLSTEGPAVPLLTERHPSMNDAIMEDDDCFLIQYMMDVLREQVRSLLGYNSITHQSTDHSATI